MKKFIFSLLFLTMANSTLFAENELSFNLMEVEISAHSRKLYSELGRILTVIERDEITQLPVLNIDELLHFVAGIDVRQRSLGGVQTDISIRGGSFDQVLILLNGVNITNPHTGHYNLDIPLNLADVARIEILQGSAARVLGANAFSGAINIITEHAGQNELTGKITTGKFNTRIQNVSANYGRNNFRSFISVSQQQSDGHIENTDYDISNAFIHLIQRTENAGKFDFQFGVQDKAYGANSFYSFRFPNQFAHTRTFFSAINWSMDKGNWRLNAQAYWRQHHDRFELFRDYVGAADAPFDYDHHNYHQSDVTGGRTTATYSSLVGRFTLGVDLRNEHIFSNVLGKEMESTRPAPFAKPLAKNAFFTHSDNRFLTNIFVDYTTQIDRFHFSTGGALNHTEAFGTHYFGGFEFGYEANDFLRLFTSFNSAVRLPTFTELYFRNAEHIPNPDLMPETSQTFEAGLKYQKRNWSLDACVFYRLGGNIIDWIRPLDSLRWESHNLTNINAFGADVSFRYNFRHNVFRNITFVYSFLHLDKKMDESAEGFESKYALDYLRHKCVFTTTHVIWRNLTATWRASFMDRAGNYSVLNPDGILVTKDYEPFFLLDTRLAWSERRFDVFVDVNNIFNSIYADYGGLVQPGINWNVGVRFRIN